MVNYSRAVRQVAKRYPAVRRRYKVYAPAVKQLASDVMYLKGLINSEPMFHTFSSANNFDYNGTLLSLSDIPNGDLAYQRTGNRVLPRFVTVHMHINQGINAAYATHVTHRVILCRLWSESSSSAPTAVPSDVLNSTQIGTQFAPLAFLTPNNTGPRGDRNRRIEVLHSECFTLDQVGDTSRTITWNVEVNKGNQKKEHIEFFDNTTAQPISGGFYLLVINDQAVANATQQSYTVMSKITFYDN